MCPAPPIGPALAVISTLVAQVLGSPNLVRNSDFERAFVAGGPADGWTAANSPEGGRNAVVRGAGLDGGSAHTIAVPDGCALDFYQCAQTIRGARPGGQYVATVYIRTADVHGGAGAYFGVNFFNAEDQRLSWVDAHMRTGTTDWVRVSQTFTVPAEATQVKLVLVLHGYGQAWYDRAQVEEGSVASDWLARESSRADAAASAPGEAQPAMRGRVAFYRDDIPPAGVASSPDYLAELARALGYECAFLDTDQLADESELSIAEFDLVVLPYGSSFPAAAAESLLAFLRDGGGLVSVGGYPLDRLLARQNGAWVSVEDLEPDSSALHPIAGLSSEREGWMVSGRDVPRSPAVVARSERGPALELSTPALSGWVSLTSPSVDGLPAGYPVTAFWARADSGPVTLSFEWIEADGSRWRDTVRLSDTWRLHVVPHSELGYWHDNPSQGRGGPGDRFRPENARHVGFGLTTEFLKSGRPYTVHIAGISLGVAPLPPWRDLCLNSSRGTINPATFLQPPASAISICDASAPLDGVSYLAPHRGAPLLREDWRLAAETEGWSATGQTAQGYAGAPLKARWVPIVDALDRYGRIRGTAVAVMHNFAGEYPGSSWAYSGVSDRDLFERGSREGAELFEAILARVVGGAYLFDATTSYASLRIGEDAAPSVRVANLARRDRTLTLRLRVRDGERLLGGADLDVKVGAKSSEQVSTRFAVPSHVAGPLMVFEWELAAEGLVVDRLSTGAVLWDESGLAGGPALSYADCYLSRGRGPEFLLGSQLYWGNQTLTGCDPLRWDHQLAMMADNGISIARSFMSPRGGYSEEGWRYRDAMVQLAQARGVSLLYTGVSWPTTDPDEVAERARVAEQAARRYMAAPGWFVDIVNEPYLRVGEGQADSREFARFLQSKYGSFDELRAAWGAELTEPSWEAIEAKPVRGSWSSVRAIDTEIFMAQAMRTWSRHTAEAVHAVDPRRLVTVGHLQGFGDHATMWDPIVSSYDMDLANRHYYGDVGRYGPELAQIDLRVLGKAPSTGEFGGTSHPGLAEHMVYAPSEELDRAYSQIVHTCFGLGGAFAANWHFQDPIEDIFPTGLLWADDTPRPIFHTYRNLGVLLRCTRPRYQPAEVYFVVPQSHRVGASKAAVGDAMVRGLRALMSVHVNFGVVPEDRLDALPPSARLLIWPVPFCPADDAYRQVLGFVRDGGALYLSGDLSYDELRRRTRTDRLRELCGVEFVAERYPDISRPPGASAPVTAVGDGPLARALAEAAIGDPCIQVRPVEAAVLASAGSVPAATLRDMGQGSVLYVLDPIESHSSPRGILRALIEHLGIARHGVAPDTAEVHSHRISSVDGGVAQVLVNASVDRVNVTVTDLPERLALALEPGRGGAAIFDGEGRLVALEAASAVVGDRAVWEADSTVIAVSLDGGNLPDCERMLILPSRPGVVTLGMAAGPTAAVGEVVGGEWQEYERTTLVDGRLAIDEAMARSWLVLGPEEELHELGSQVAREML